MRFSRGGALPPPTLLSLPFTTTFSGGSENPASESGVWRRAANSWHDNRIISGVMRPTQKSDAGTDDCYMLLDPAKFSGGIPNNVEVIATLDLGSGQSQEHELLLRFADTNDPSGTARGYECLYNANDGSTNIIIWKGPFNQGNPTSWQDITATVNSPGVGATGNQIRATIVGSAITFYWRANSGNSWTQIATATDATWASGTCGAGFFVTTAGGGSIDACGFTDYQVNAL
jgi:hypothetical protein